MSGLSEEMRDPHHARETLMFVQRALKEGWKLPADLLTELPKLVDQWMRDESIADKRTRIRAAELLASLQKENMAALVTLAKEVRLDTPGEATEKQKIEVVYVDRIDNQQD